MYGYVYTERDKEAIKRNPLNRDNAKNIRAITTRYYRDFQGAERAYEATSAEKSKKEAFNAMNNAKDSYEKSLSKFKLYKEIFPEIVQ